LAKPIYNPYNFIKNNTFSTSFDHTILYRNVFFGIRHFSGELFNLQIQTDADFSIIRGTGSAQAESERGRLELAKPSKSSLTPNCLDPNYILENPKLVRLVKAMGVALFRHTVRRRHCLAFICSFFPVLFTNDERWGISGFLTENPPERYVFLCLWISERTFP
jgi:hypothetical protein